MLASLKPSTKEVSLLSIPRDLTISVEGMGWQKINAINAFAEAKKEGSGGQAVSQALSDVLDIPVHYYFRIDFETFVNLVDLVGGLEVNVENTLNDYSYPIAGRENNEDYYSRFEHLYIEEGLQTMDGELALKYARSRHASGIEGSDFARAKRQQKIIQAFKDKLLSKENLFKPSVISGIINELSSGLSFNLKIGEAIKLWQMFKDINNDDIVTNVLDNGPDGLLVAGRSEAGAYILSPKGGDFTEIKHLINNLFESEKEDVFVKTEVEDLANIEIKNGTWINGLANQAAIDLKNENFDVLRVSNCSRRDFENTVIYDLTYGSKNEALKYLKKTLKAEVHFDVPLWLAEEIKNETIETNEIPDFLIILGEEASTIGI
jgi:polyisoprenyl-teichoic acid--peptidoglycan teichoic acid transferase